jgi:YHS domain-containing protein
MKLNLKIASSLLAAAMVTGGALGLSTLRADDAAAPATSQPAAATNTKCPISGDPVDAKVTTVYNGKTYAFCCADCVKAFNKDPAKYAAAAK